MIDRKEIETKATTITTDLKTRIEAKPIPAFFAGMGIGVCLALFRGLLIPLLVLTALIVGVMWLLGEDKANQQSASETKAATTEKTKVEPEVVDAEVAKEKKAKTSKNGSGATPAN